MQKRCAVAEIICWTIKFWSRFIFVALSTAPIQKLVLSELARFSEITPLVQSTGSSVQVRRNTAAHTKKNNHVRFLFDFIDTRMRQCLHSPRRPRLSSLNANVGQMKIPSLGAGLSSTRLTSGIRDDHQSRHFELQNEHAACAACATGVSAARPTNQSYRRLYYVSKCSQSGA